MSFEEKLWELLLKVRKKNLRSIMMKLKFVKLSTTLPRNLEIKHYFMVLFLKFW